MSLAFRPGATYPITLPSDKEAPEDQRPAFTAVHLSADEWNDFADFADDKVALKALGRRKIIAELKRHILEHLRGWARVMDKNGPVPFEQAFDRWPLTLDETWDLYDEIRLGSRLSVTEKNASTSPSASPTDSSAAAGPAPVSP
jgi:hypothetical protein